MENATERRLCAVCGDEIEPGEDPHYLHEADCTEDTCTCDRPVHPDCCPEPDCAAVEA